jgi:hypothetical protein
MGWHEMCYYVVGAWPRAGEVGASWSRTGSTGAGTPRTGAAPWHGACMATADGRCTTALLERIASDIAVLRRSAAQNTG